MMRLGSALELFNFFFSRYREPFGVLIVPTQRSNRKASISNSILFAHIERKEGNRRL